jgi:hypothetical protein
MKHYVLIFAGVLLAFNAMVQAGKDPAPEGKSGEKPNVIALMHQFLGHMSALKPFIANEGKMFDPKNDAMIRKELRGLVETARETHYSPTLQKPGLRFSREVLSGHVQETERMFKKGKKEYARWMLQSTLGICMSCHTQMPATSKSFEVLASVDQFMSPFEQAEFLFATRQFDKALEMYDKVIRQFPKGKVGSDQVEDALERQVAYFTRIKRDPKGGKAYLQKALTNEDLPFHARTNIRAWMALFNEWEKEKTPDMKTISEDDLRAYVKKSLKPDLWDKMIDASNPRVITYLKISGLLYEYLEHHPNTALTPEIYFWLAQCDRILNNNFFYSLADLYLKDCVMRFPEHPIASECYKEYEESVIVNHTGSAGTNLTQEAELELKRLKSLLPRKN